NIPFTFFFSGTVTRILFDPCTPSPLYLGPFTISSKQHNTPPPRTTRTTTLAAAFTPFSASSSSSRRPPYRTAAQLFLCFVYVFFFLFYFVFDLFVFVVVDDDVVEGLGLVVVVEEFLSGGGGRGGRRIVMREDNRSGYHRRWRPVTGSGFDLPLVVSGLCGSEWLRRMDSSKDNRAVKIVGAIAGAAVALFGIWSQLSGSALASASDADRMMKAPGKDEYIKRADFERDPKSYFRDLRK
ncbi:hypothetical protein AKJ16_DCAP01733, partial [Drosera capensis]